LPNRYTAKYMKGLLSILVALILLMPNGSLFAQVENEIEYYFGKEVTETIEQFLSEQEFDQGEPFILILGNNEGINRIAILNPPANSCDSLLIKRTSRFTSINGSNKKILFEEDYNFSVQEWTPNPLADYPKRLPKKCSVIHESPYIIKFDRNGVIEAGYDN